MDNKNYIVINGKKAELTEEQLKQLGIEVKDGKRWRGERGHKYYYVDEELQVDWGTVECCGVITDTEKIRYDTHNYFKTHIEAQEYAEVLEIKRQLMKFADEHNGEIDNERLGKYGLYYDKNAERIRVFVMHYFKLPETIYFSSSGIAKQAIDTIGEENIIKYLTYNY